jgi:catechol 2,3-dioxygenase
MKPSLQLRSVHLRVRDLARSVDFYAEKLGFVVLEQSASRAVLATTADSAGLLTLSEGRQAALAPPDAAGLFHAALLVPDRATLGQWLRRPANNGVKFAGFSDHGVSEAIYLADPDGNGLEFYVDRLRDQWPHSRDGTLAMITEPLALPTLLAEAARAPARNPILADAHWGHLHLQVRSLDQSQQFYETALGVKLMQRFGTSARFLAADGYHHHLGLNTWNRARVPQPASALGLAEAVFVKIDATSSQILRDPDGIAVRIEPRK